MSIITRKIELGHCTVSLQAEVKYFRKATVLEYSWEQWKYHPTYTIAAGLGSLEWEEGLIEVIKPQDIQYLLKEDDFYMQLWKSGKLPTFKGLLTHEYTHWLQLQKGGGKETVPLGIKAPITPLIKKVYQKEDWLVEAEAFYIEKRPQLLEEYEKLVS